MCLRTFAYHQKSSVAEQAEFPLSLRRVLLYEESVKVSATCFRLVIPYLSHRHQARSLYMSNGALITARAAFTRTFASQSLDFDQHGCSWRVSHVARAP